MQADGFLAHAEHFMIKHMDNRFWPNALAKGNGGISEQCFLRVLRGALHGRQHANEALEQLEATKIICRSCRTRYCKHVHPSEGATLDYNALDVSVTTLALWNEQDP